MQTVISYIRDNQRRPLAALVSIPVSDNKFAVGYSQLHDDDIKKNVNFNKKFGVQIAVNRAENGIELSKIVKARKIGFEELNNFIARSRRYYKDRELINKD